MDNHWYIQFDSHHKGPFADQEVMSLWKEQKIQGDSFFWKKGMSHWERMDRLDSFKDFFPPKDIPENHIEKLYNHETSHDRRYDQPLPELPKIDEPLREKSIDQNISSTENITISKRKNDSGFPFQKAFLLFLVLGALGSSIFLLKDRSLRRPESLSPHAFQRLREVTKINPLNHIQFETYYDSTKNRFWFSTNLKENLDLQVQFQSIKGKVLSLSGILFNGYGKLDHHLGSIEAFEFERGIQIYPGLYKVTFFYTLDRLPKSYSDIVYLGPGSEDEFSRNLKTYQGLMNKIFKKYKEELLLKYQTLISLTKDMEREFNEGVNKKSSRRLGPELENYYIKNIGPFLTKFTLDSFERPGQIRLDISAIKNLFGQIFQESKKISELNAQLLSDIRSSKRLSLEKREELRLKYAKKFQDLKKDLYLQETQVKKLELF